MIFGEEDGHTYITIKTEVTIVIHETDDLETLDLPPMLPPARTLLHAPDEGPARTAKGGRPQ